MKVTKTYDLIDEDDKQTYEMEHHAVAMYNALFQIKQDVRSIWKHREHTTVDQATESIEEIYQIICDNVSELNLDI